MWCAVMWQRWCRCPGEYIRLINKSDALPGAIVINRHAIIINVRNFYVREIVKFISGTVKFCFLINGDNSL